MERETWGRGCFLRAGIHHQSHRFCVSWVGVTVKINYFKPVWMCVFYSSLLEGRLMKPALNYLSQRETLNFHQGKKSKDYFGAEWVSGSRR